MKELQNTTSIEEATTLVYKNNGTSLARSSPHLVSMEWVKKNLCFSTRRIDIIIDLDEFLLSVKTSGARPTCILMGGGFLSSKEYPRDIDALVVYRADDKFNITKLIEIYESRSKYLDIKIVPDDAGPTLLIKTACFFHTLFQDDRIGRNKGSVLIQL